MSQLLNRFLGTGNALARLQDHAARLRRLQGVLDRHLPGTMIGACSVANLKGDTLIVLAKNGAVAAKLKQLATTLTAQFNATGVAIRAVQVKVMVRDPGPPQRAPTARALSDSGRESLQSFADSLPADAPLRASIERLVQRSRGGTDEQ